MISLQNLLVAAAIVIYNPTQKMFVLAIGLSVCMASYRLLIRLPIKFTRLSAFLFIPADDERHIHLYEIFLDKYAVVNKLGMYGH